ncbi:MAG: TetR/AcrR family transcriptional regulator [Acidobacteria bacterium]|nr:TetR/AcrR family transcriptional regulator [Acidobacteriota bacterium]
MWTVPTLGGIAPTAATAGAAAKRKRQPDATRAKLLQAARELFAAVGYHDTGTEEIVALAGVTRGALYHHFVDKEDLFRCVVAEVIEEAVESVQVVAAASPTEDQWSMAIRGMLAYLDGCLAPARARILLVDGPMVFGLAAVVEIAERSMNSRWEQRLRDLMAAGHIDAVPVEPLGHLLASVVSEAGIYVSRSTDPQRARRDVGIVLERWANGLRPLPRS